MSPIYTPHTLTFSCLRHSATLCKCEPREFSPSSHTLLLRFILELSSHLRQGLAVRLFHSGFQLEVLMQFTSLPSVLHVWPISSSRLLPQNRTNSIHFKVVWILPSSLLSRKQRGTSNSHAECPKFWQIKLVFFNVNESAASVFALLLCCV
jgi:hypothetical protein